VATEVKIMKMNLWFAKNIQKEKGFLLFAILFPQLSSSTLLSLGYLMHHHVDVEDVVLILLSQELSGVLHPSPSGALSSPVITFTQPSSSKSSLHSNTFFMDGPFVRMSRRLLACF
jgi:hypothetical protein